MNIQSMDLEELKRVLNSLATAEEWNIDLMAEISLEIDKRN